MRGKIALSATLIAIAAAAGLAAPASAEVSGVHVTISETSLIVTGIESDPGTCGLVIVEVADQPSGAVYREWKYNGDPNWSVTFWGLQPGTTYAVRVEDDYCTPYAVPDPAFRQLYTWTTASAKSLESVEPRPADRFGYCSVAGNTRPDGSPIAAGTFLNLVLGQPGFDPHYTGAYPSFYIAGVGITCSPPQGLASLQGPPLRADAGGNPTPDGFYYYVPRL